VFAFNAANVSGGAIFAKSAEFTDASESTFIQNAASHSAGGCFFVQTSKILLRAINSTYDSSLKQTGFAALSSCRHLTAKTLIVYRSQSPSGGSVFSNFRTFWIGSSRFLREETECSVCLTGEAGGRIQGSTFGNLSAGSFVVSTSSGYCYVHGCTFSRAAAFCFSANSSILAGETNVYDVAVHVERPVIQADVISLHLLHDFPEDLPVAPPSESPRALGRGPKRILDMRATIAVVAIIGLTVGVLWYGIRTVNAPKMPRAIGAGRLGPPDPTNLADLDGLF
jgi:hypothetical protein